MLSSLNAVISTNESTQIITGHVIYNPEFLFCKPNTQRILKRILEFSENTFELKICKDSKMELVDEREL